VVTIQSFLSKEVTFPRSSKLLNANIALVRHSLAMCYRCLVPSLQIEEIMRNKNARMDLFAQAVREAQEEKAKG
jgi:hypothetical protein